MNIQIRVRNGWIFSKKEDILFFVFPLLVGAVLVGSDRYFNLKSSHLGGFNTYVIIFSLLAFFDASHVFSTIFKSYLDTNERRHRKILLFLVPLLIYLLLILIYNIWGLKIVLILFGYYNVYHIVRQQYGWVSISARKANENNKLDYYFDKITIYTFMVLPVVWAHFSFPATDKQISIPKSKTAASICIALLMLTFVLYFARQIFKLFTGKAINFSKMLQMTTSFISWGAVIVFQSPLLLVITVLLHGIPYLGIVYKQSGMNKRIERGPFFLKMGYPLWFFLIVVFTLGLLYTKMNNVVKISFSLGLFKEYLICALLVFPIMHFTIDGVIWRRKSYKV